MAKSRYVKDSMRSDNWFTDLLVSEKLLFAYLLTNDKVGLCGVYELPIKKIQRETSIDSGTLSKAFERFESVGKICYRNGRVMIVNFLKNQSMNDNMIKGAKREAENISKNVWLSFADFKGFERLSKDFECFDILNLTLLNLTLPVGTGEEGNSNDVIGKITNDNIVIDKYTKRIELRTTASSKLEGRGVPGFSIPRKLTKDHEECINKLIKKGIDFDDYKIALQNYGNEILKRGDGSYKEHRFTFIEFLKQTNGVAKFI